MLGAAFHLACGSAPAAPYVDGISDQSLPAWDGGFSGSPFAAYFSRAWIARGHISYARYAVQWNIMREPSSGPSASGDYRERFEAWYRDASALGLTLDVSLAAYRGGLPSVGEYVAHVGEMLGAFKSIRYLEAWNEPNDTPGMTVSLADLYTNAASALCDRAACTVIAGNLLDGPGLLAYEVRYERGLRPLPSLWGVHPYYAVAERSGGAIADFVDALPDRGAGDQLWFTEVGAYDCWRGVRYGEQAQAAAAAWLTRSLMPAIRPAHVFYYELLFEDARQPPCDGTSADTALYVPGDVRDVPDAPRPAASYIFAGADLPSAFTGSAAALRSGSESLTGSVYPAGASAASYHFEYGASTDYGAVTGEGRAGSGFGGLAASTAVGGLLAGSTYHYRLVAWNLGGSDTLGYGADREFVAGGAGLLAFGPNAARELVSFGQRGGAGV